MRTPEKIELFMGLQVSKELGAYLDSLPAEKRDLFISSTGKTLTEAQYGNKRFLGKPCGQKLEFGSMQQIEANILTLLSKLDVYPETSLTLFPLIHS